MEAQNPSSSGGLRTAFLDRVESLPELRQIPWRLGHELPLEVPIESLRVQQRGALAVATRGKVEEEKCIQCAGGFGRFSECVSLGDWFQGACAGCVYTSKGHRCSLRSRLPENEAGNPLPHQMSNPGLVKEQTDARENSSSSKKRKRRSAPSSTLTPSHQTLSEDQGRRLSGARFSDIGSVRQVDIDRNDIAAEQRAALEREQQDKRSQNGPSQSQLQRSPPQGFELNTRKPGPFSRPSDPQNNYFESPHRSPSTGLPPQKRLKPSQNHIEEDRSLTPGSTTWQKQTMTTNSQSDPVIDSLPKPKQRQIYSLVSGLQRGISHLEKQLSSLKDLLGIDNDGQDRDAR